MPDYEGMYSILLVEDNAELREALQKLLEKDHKIIAVSTVAQARAEIERANFHLALLDWELPDGEGLELCDLIQKNPKLKNLPVVFLTGRSLLDDKERAFAIGADDYIVKPFEGRELRARIKAKLAKAERIRAAESEFTYKNLRFMMTTQTVMLDLGDKTERALDLTPVEFRLLLYFAQRSDRILTRNELMQQVWGAKVHVLDRTIDTHVSHLRAKLVKAGCTIKAVPKKGYRLIMLMP